MKGKEGECAPNHGVAIGDLIFCKASRYARWSPSGERISISCAESCFSFLESPLLHVSISCESESDCSATTIADMDEKFCNFLHSWESINYTISTQARSGSRNEKHVVDGSTSAIRTKCLNLVERLSASLNLVQTYQQRFFKRNVFA